MTQKEKFTIDAKDEEILETISYWLNESQSYHEYLLQRQNVCEQYYLGNQTERNSIPIYQSSEVENRIFEGVETITPVATANAHQFVVLPGSEAETSVAKANVLQKVLTRKYETLLIQDKLEDITRHIILYRFGVLKYFWDRDEDDVAVKVIDPRLIMIPRLRVNYKKLPYVIEIQEYTREEIEENFPEIKPDELAFEKSEGAKEGSKETYKVFEIWTNEMVVWATKGKILDKKQNPFFDFSGETKKRTLMEIFQRKSVETAFRNHLKRPEKPFIFFTVFKVGNESIGSTSLTEQAIPLQDLINKQKRRIVDNLKQMGNGQVYVDLDAMTQEEADNITNEPGLVIRGKGIASENKIRREAGVPLPNGHFSNLQHTEMVFDNLMGLHPATRGAGAAKTLGQDIISRQQDFSRIDLITRILNRGVAELANGLVQLMKMFYNETQIIPMLGEEGAVEFERLNRDDIEDYIEIVVKSGQQLPMDEISQRNEAVQLWQLGAIGPVTLFKRLKFPNPEEAAAELLTWKQGQLTMEAQVKIAEAQAGAQAKADLEIEKNKGIETPLNVLQRSKANLGGTAPVAPGTSNM